jgi:hypothetical protein
MRNRIFRYARLALLLLVSYSSFSQTQLSAEVYGRPRIPSPTSFYSQKYYFHDLAEGQIKYYANEWAKLYPGNVNPFDNLELPQIPVTEVVETLNNPKKTLVCDASANFDEILSIDDPSLLSFKNGGAYVAVNNDIKYVSRLEFIGDDTRVAKHDLKKATEEFSLYGFDRGLSPDIITVDFQPGQYVITGYKSTSSGKTYLYHRVNMYINKLRNKCERDHLSVLTDDKYFWLCSINLVIQS